MAAAADAALAACGAKAAHGRSYDLPGGAALPYRDIDQSGVLYTALAFGNAIVASSIGGFTEVAEDHGALVPVPPGDPAALRNALAALIDDDGARAAQERRAAAAAAGPYSWDEAARLTLELYESLT